MHPTFNANAATHVGLVRDNNEDAYLIAGPWQELDCTLLAVADGMGGYQAGETASRMVCHRLNRDLVQTVTAACGQGAVDGDGLVYALEKLVYTIHRDVFELGQVRANLYGMGATLSALLLVGEPVEPGSRVLTAQVGDSRIYRLRAGELTQLTEDQTEIQRYVKLGRLTPEEAATHHLRHIISQAIGGRKDSYTGAVISRYDLQPGDRFLICSDGLHDLVDDATITDVLRHGENRQACCAQLIDLALQAGGKDNVTVLVADDGPVEPDTAGGDEPETLVEG